ncbi:MAG: hypothetical protein ACK56I_14585, partial [bacterium]
MLGEPVNETEFQISRKRQIRAGGGPRSTEPGGGRAGSHHPVSAVGIGVQPPHQSQVHFERGVGFQKRQRHPRLATIERV